MPELINTLLNHAPCGFLAFTDDGWVLAVNETLSTLLGYEPDTLNGQPINQVLPIASRIFYQTHFFPLLKLQGKVEEVYFSLRSKRGQDIPMLVNAVRRQNADPINHCIFISIHHRIQYENEILAAKKQAEIAIQAQKQAEAALREQYDRTLLLRDLTQRIRQTLDLQQIFATAVGETRQLIHADRVGIFQFRAASQQGEGEFVAESVAESWDSVMAILVEDHCFEEQFAVKYQQGRVLALEDVEQAGLLDCHYQTLKRFQIRANLVSPLLNGSELWGLLCIHQCSAPRHWQAMEIDLVQQIAGQLAIAIQQADLFGRLQQELSERQRVEVELREMNQKLFQSNQELSEATTLLKQLVNIDGLTQVANRRYFDECLQEEWERLSRQKQPLSLILFDIDYFKRYNDSQGHPQGDRCLIQVAQAVQYVVARSTDRVARYGGEEFAVILPHTDHQGAITIAQRIHQAIQDCQIHHPASEVSDLVTISLGVASLIPDLQRSPAVLIEQADHALYAAKQQGRNQTVLFTESLLTG